MNIFITGATGFLGKYLLEAIAPLFDEVYVLSRQKDLNLFKDLNNVKIINGDVTHPQMLKNREDLDLLISKVDIVIHAAALYDIKASYSDSYLHNVVGTQNTLRLAKKIKNLRAFYYISTIAVGDDSAFFLEENVLPKRRKFNDHYSHTKYQAEALVREASDQFAVRIIRPGIIVGDSKTGKMSKCDGPYYFMDALKKHSLLLKTVPLIPLSYDPRTKIPMIPVDHCARYISLLLKRDDFGRDLKTYHLISSDIPTVREFLKDLNRVLGLSTEYLPVFRNPFHNSLLKLLGIPKEVVPFMFSKLSYDKTRTIKELPEIKESVYSAYRESLFHYLD